MTTLVRRAGLLAGTIALGLGLVDGASAKPKRQPARPDADPSLPGVVFVVEGIGGIDCIGVAAQHALPKAGVPHEIRLFIWTHGKGKYFKDLQDSRHVHQKAEELAEEVLAFKTEHPDRPVYLVGKSGGAGLVLSAAEHLPPATIERIVLLSAAVATDYDLRVALQATRREIVSFYSVHDHLILGWGTSKFGTIDRVYGPAAGWRGFVVPDSLGDEDRSAYGRLVQIPWNADMILEGHLGTHLGTSMPGFLGKEVSPWLK